PSATQRPPSVSPKPRASSTSCASGAMMASSAGSSRVTENGFAWGGGPLPRICATGGPPCACAVATPSTITAMARDYEGRSKLRESDDQKGVDLDVVVPLDRRCMRGGSPGSPAGVD